MKYIVGLVSFLAVLLFHGAVPFLMTPTTGQAVWSMGFAQDYSNGSLLNWHAHSIGTPTPAAIAFGLAGAWPAGLLIRLGFHAADAYSAVAALWLGISMLSSYRLGRLFGTTKYISFLGAITWVTMPMIWAHAEYSMLSWGIALLPLYFLVAFQLFLINSSNSKLSLKEIIPYFLAATIAVFMDGYTFMMFATGATILLACSYITQIDKRLVILKVSLPCHVLSFFSAYLLYSLFIGRSAFDAHSIDIFRAWGLDLSFFVIPTEGVLALPDALGLSLKRTDTTYFGDESVWRTTYGLPIFILGGYAYWQLKSKVKIVPAIAILTLFAFYMALGPSVKINSTKPLSERMTVSMAAKYAIAPTGNAWISRNIPGFNVMRASYRWAALGVFGLWLLVIIGGSVGSYNAQKYWCLGLITIILFNIPHPIEELQRKIDARKLFFQIDKELVNRLHPYINSGEQVAFIPWTNDSMVNYLAPKLKFRAFNIGGDKNLLAAQLTWPVEMNHFGYELNLNKRDIAVKMLIDNSVDVLVVPYFNSLWSPHIWPCPDETIANLSALDLERYRSIPGFVCPSYRKMELQPFLSSLRELPYLDIVDTDIFATIRIRDEFDSVEFRKDWNTTKFRNIQYPIILGEEFTDALFVLREGWYGMESNHVWSNSYAKLTLPIPETCKNKECFALIYFKVFAAEKHHKVTVRFKTDDDGPLWHHEIAACSSDMMVVKVPLKGVSTLRGLKISVPNANSPLKLYGSEDPRILGISLYRIEISNV